MDINGKTRSMTYLDEGNLRMADGLPFILCVCWLVSVISGLDVMYSFIYLFARGSVLYWVRYIHVSHHWFMSINIPSLGLKVQLILDPPTGRSSVHCKLMKILNHINYTQVFLIMSW